MDKVNVTDRLEKVQTGISCIDNLMAGGLEKNVLTEIFGEGGSGKSNLCMQFAVSELKKGKKVIFLDTEGLSTERLMQISSGDQSVLDRLMLYRVTSLDDQELSIIKTDKLMEKEKEVSLVVIDSFTEYFRLEKTSETASRISLMQRQISLLSALALKFSVPVLITNQIYLDVDSKNLQPFGGYVIDHSMKAIYSVVKTPNGARKLVVVKHRSIEEGSNASFRLASFGLTCDTENEQHIKDELDK